MKPFHLAGLVPLILSGCGGGLTGTAVSPNAVFTGQVDNITYDPATNQLIIGNLEFDGPSERYDATGITTVPGYGVFKNPQVGETGQFRYIAVYGEGSYGSVGAVGTGDYGGFGPGGAMYTTNGNTVRLPTVRGELIYDGTYAGIRVLGTKDDDFTADLPPSPLPDPTRPPSPDLSLTSGTTQLLVDLRDPANKLAILGWVRARQLIDQNGTVVGTLPDIPLSETTISADTATFNGLVDATPGTGTYQGAFTGPNGQEILGFLVFKGVDGATGSNFKETGVFIAVD